MPLLDTDVIIPDYTTLGKRSATLPVELPVQATGEPMHIVIDSTGLKIFGEGEWKVRQHGYTKRRTWRKLHLSVDEKTQMIQAVVLTEARVHDADGGSQLLTETTGEIDQLSGDGTYHKRKIYEACAEREVKQITIPPARNARIWQHGNSKQPPLPPSGPPPLK